jgi:hypothetical protein
MCHVQDNLKEMEYKERELRERLETPTSSHRNLQSEYLAQRMLNDL